MIQAYIFPLVAVIAAAFFAFQIRFLKIGGKGTKRITAAFVLSAVMMFVFPIGFLCRCGIMLHHFLDLVLTLALCWFLYRYLCWRKLYSLSPRARKEIRTLEQIGQENFKEIQNHGNGC